jgi:hypothetical protein
MSALETDGCVFRNAIFKSSIVMLWQLGSKQRVTLS